MNHYPRVTRPVRHDRVLIVAPHVDDEAIAAAGYAADAIASGAEVYVVFVTAGDCNRFSARMLSKTLGPTPLNYLSMGRMRIAEADAAMRMLGIPRDHYFMLGYPDRGLRAMLANRDGVVRSLGTLRRSVPYDEALSPGSPYTYNSLMTDMEHVIAIARPTTVIAPVAFDLHPDHSATADIVDETLESSRLQPQRLGYLVHANRIPTALVSTPARALKPPSRMRRMTWATYPLTPMMQKSKDDVLRVYKSQGPYVSLLRNAFVRTNELFLVYDQAACNDVIPPGAPAGPRIAIAR